MLYMLYISVHLGIQIREGDFGGNSSNVLNDTE